MIDHLFLDFTDVNTGRLLHMPPSYYAAAVGWNFCDAGHIASMNMSWAAFFSFATSVIPDHAQIDVVQLFIRRRADPVGEPEDYRLKFSIGSFIGPALDGNAAEWTGGSLMVTRGIKPVDASWLDLGDDGQDPCLHINKTGTTDIKIWDDSTKGIGDDMWSTNFNTDTVTGCKLYIEFSVPSATATGIGTASCSAKKMAHASATATGTASGVVVGRVVCSAASTVVGRGEALGRAAIVAHARATGTGVATASMVGAVIYRPLAIHEASLSIGASHTSALSTRATHNANVTCDPKDEAIRGPRRAN